MKKVVWGTGLHASRFMASINVSDISFFIDNNKKKENAIFFGKRIVHPTSINEWKDLFIFVPFNFYNEISQQLIMYGLKEGINFTKYDGKIRLNGQQVKDDCERAIAEIVENKDRICDKGIFWGHVWNLSISYKRYLQSWLQNSESSELILVSEEVWKKQEEAEEEADIPTIVAPKIFDLEPAVYDCEYDPLIEQTIAEKRYLTDTIELVQKILEDANINNAKWIVYFAYMYINNIISLLIPRFIIAFSGDKVLHKILEKVCNEKGVPIFFTHQATLPGTIFFEPLGGVGHNVLVKYSKQFKNLFVEDKDIKKARQVLGYLCKSGLNVKVQPKNDFSSYIKDKVKKDRPIILCAGEYDIMVPYNDGISVFKSSIEEVIYLADLCKKNDWNIIYKPHPNNIGREELSLLPDNVIYLENANINSVVDTSDIVITTFSSTSYTGLIRGKPVVIMGYNDLKDKGCAYEVYKKTEVEEALKAALLNGFTEEQQKAFEIHVAQLLKYYVYDDLRDRELRYGKPALKDEESLWEVCRLFDVSKY